MFAAGEVTERLFDALRRPRRSGCGNAAGSLATAPAAFLQQRELFAAAGAAEAAAGSVPELEQLGRGVCRQLLLHQQEQPHYPGLGPECPLLARKFSEGTVKVGKVENMGALAARLLHAKAAALAVVYTWVRSLHQAVQQQPVRVVVPCKWCCGCGMRMWVV